MIDQLEGILTSAEESRNRRDTLRVPEASGGPPAKPAVSSYKPSTNGGSSTVAPEPGSAEARHWARTVPAAVEEPARVASAVGHSGDEPGSDGSRSESADVDDPAPDGDPQDELAGGTDDGSSSDADAEATAPEDTSDTHGPNRDEKPPPMELDADAEVDPVMLAKEFSGLLQVESGDDEASS